MKQTIITHSSIHLAGAHPDLPRLNADTVAIRYHGALSIFCTSADLRRLVETITAFQAAEARTRAAQ